MSPAEQESLTDRLARFPVERYPVQHATTQFHLGSARLHAGDVAGAVGALAVAKQIFEEAGLALEAAKTTVMLGVAHRTAGRFDHAVEAFTAAARRLGELAKPAEQAAAAYNLGLVLQDRGDHEAAHQAWARAHELFLGAGHPAQAAAAARDHGASRLARGDVEGARPLLETAAALAERAGDDVGSASASNALGLALLAAGDPAAAVAALRNALGFVPRAVRPADHAMIKANLALAYEQSGDAPRSRLAARQAAAVPDAAPPVRAQAREVLGRLGSDVPDDLSTVLDDEERDQWVPVVREEVLRAVELPAPARRDVVGHFLDGLLARPETAYARAETLLAVVLELPPRAYGLLVEAIVGASSDRRRDDDADRLQAILGSAMARFAMPQWQRLAASLNAAAEAAGLPTTWR